jgi:hypothetical protein
MKEVILNEDFYYFNCPHCDSDIIVNKNELNCHIFRHAVFKHNSEPVNPHLSKEECESLLKQDLIYGCCKPFEVISSNNKFYAVICEYK